MEFRDLILELCHEAGGAGPENELVEEWEADHACCCKLHVYKVSQGDLSVLNNIRRCMGLQLMH